MTSFLIQVEDYHDIWEFQEAILGVKYCAEELGATTSGKYIGLLYPCGQYPKLEELADMLLKAGICLVE